MFRKIIQSEIGKNEVLISLPEMYIGKELEILVFTKEEGLDKAYFDDSAREEITTKFAGAEGGYSRLNSFENSDSNEADELKYWLQRGQELINNFEQRPKKQISFTVLNTQGQSFTFNREEANER
jgi:hypothetical protein